MIKNHKKELIISSLLILAPILAGVILWDRLPDVMATHWGIDNQANGWSSKAFTVFGLPLILEAIHWVCLIGTSFDKRNKGHNEKVLGLFYWLVPIVSIIASGMTYSIALGNDINVKHIALGLLSIIFIILGNFMPKVTQNSTLGIKIKWTLESEANWNATHRLAGKLWFSCGFIILICIFIPQIVSIWIAGAALLVAAIVPCIYSYRFSKR